MEVKLNYGLSPVPSLGSSQHRLFAKTVNEPQIPTHSPLWTPPLELQCNRFSRILKLRRDPIRTDTSAKRADNSEAAPGRNRRLILLRHGKSSWSNPSIKDHDRPLNEHGRSASASLANKLRTVGWIPDLILCSDSTRTRQTLDIMKKRIPELSSVEVHFLGSFYSVSAMDGQTAQHLQETICKYSKDANYTVMCMGHNRGWEEAASIFSGLHVELKTANAALLQTSSNSWEEAFCSGAGGWNLFAILKPSSKTCSVEESVCDVHDGQPTSEDIGRFDQPISCWQVLEEDTG